MSTLIVLLLLSIPGSAQNLPDAQKKYDSADYTGAAALYHEALKTDPLNPALHYDLGDALFKAGRLGPAIASYQRAFDILPRDADIRFNLDFALRKAGEGLLPSGVPPLMFHTFYWLSERELAGLHWLSAWAALLLGAFWIRRRESRESLELYLAAALGAWLVFGGWWGVRTWLEPAERGVIVAPTAEIRSGPGDRFPVSFTAPEGRRVQILSENIIENGNWIEIGLLKEGSRGWVPSSAIEKI